MNVNRRVGMAAVALLATLVNSNAWTQVNYPSRPVVITHGFGAGGNADAVARILAEPLGDRLGQRMIVEPAPGAGGNLASSRVAKATPDGHTLILLTGGHSVSAALYKSLAFDPVDDFQMLSTTVYFPFVIAVKSDSPIKSLGDLIARAKADPGRINYSSVGVGSTQHLAGELLGSMAGIKMTHVPYRGGTAPLTDLLGGQIDVLIDSLTITAPQIAAGTIRGLAVTSPTKWQSLPDIPPVSDLVPGYDVRSWLGLATTRGIPEPVVQRLTSEIQEVLEHSPARERLTQMGMEVRPSSPDEMRSLVASEIEKWRKVISQAGIPRP